MESLLYAFIPLFQGTLPLPASDVFFIVSKLAFLPLFQGI
jgi:hypothetical protein